MSDHVADEFSPVPQITSREPNLPDNFAPVPVVKSKRALPAGAGVPGVNASNQLDANKNVSGDRSGQGPSAGRGTNRDSRPGAVDKNFNVLP